MMMKVLGSFRFTNGPNYIIQQHLVVVVVPVSFVVVSILFGQCRGCFMFHVVG